MPTHEYKLSEARRAYYRSYYAKRKAADPAYGKKLYAKYKAKTDADPAYREKELARKRGEYAAKGSEWREHKRKLHNALHRKRVRTDPAYREKCKAYARKYNAKCKARLASDPAFAEKRRVAVAARIEKARQLRSTSEGRKAYNTLSRQRRAMKRMSPEWKAKHGVEKHTHLKTLLGDEAFKILMRSARNTYWLSRDRKRNPEKYREYAQTFAKRHPLAVQYWKEQWALSVEERCATDPEYYAKHRRIARESHQRHRKTKTPFSPRPQNRIPDWAVKGERLVDTTSKFIRNNLSNAELRSADAFARDLAIERREWLTANNQV